MPLTTNGISKKQKYPPRQIVRIKPEALGGVNKRPQFIEGNPLSAFTPRELMQELHSRGYEGELTYTARINIANM